MFGRKKKNSGTESFNSLYQAGINAMEDGDVKLAASCFRKAAEIDPEQPGPHEHLCAILPSMMEIDDAVHHCQEVIRLGAQTYRTYVNLAVALGNKCQLQDAIKFARKALESSPSDLIADMASAVSNK